MDFRVSRVLETQVLVIGGGGAGITAAVAASEAGCRVLLAAKGQVGNSGNTIMIGGSYAMDGESAFYKYHIDGADPSFTKEDLYNSILNDGFFLNDQNMVEQFVEESPEICYDVQRWAQECGKAFTFYPPSQWWMSGRMMGSALKYGLRQAKNVALLEDVMIVELLKSGDAVCGALGVDIYTGELVEIRAGAVVMATGGFQPFSFKNTNSDMTGDGMAMALRAGATLSDLEFFLFLITALEPASMKGSILPLMVVSNPLFKYRAVDVEGNELKMPQKLKDLETKSEICKLLHIVYYGPAICGGRATPDGGIYLETLNTPEELDAAFDSVADLFKDYYKPGYYHGENIYEVRDMLKKTGRWKVGLSNEYALGGILVNEKMETAVPGLFAGGECASGVFGANRVADAVTEMMVQGTRAGRSAAAFARERASAVPDNLEAAVRFATEIFSHAGGTSPIAASCALEALADEGLGLIRSADKLEALIAGLAQAKAKLGDVAIQQKGLAYNLEWLSYLQLKNRLALTEISAHMALSRRESRGLHIRADYPDIDHDHFLVRQMARLEGEGVEYSSRPPIPGKVAPPTGVIPYERYLLESEIGLENIDRNK